MNNLQTVKLGTFFSHSVAGEWGSEPTGIDDVIVYRAADFSKDCKLNVTMGALRSVPKSKLSNRKLNRNDILVEKSGGSPTQPVGRAVIYKPESDEQVATCSNFLQRLVVDENYSSNFVYYLMLGLYQANSTLPYQQQTTGIYNLKLEEYLQTEIDTYVDRNLQEKVAEILSTIDNQIDATQALIDKYIAIKQGMMADLFSRGIDPQTKALRPTFKEAPELYHKTPLGMLPKFWELVRTETVAREVVVGIVIEPSKYYTTEGVTVFRSANIQENKINPQNFVHMSEESNQLNRKSMLGTGDVITVRTGYPGTTCVVTEEYDRSNAVDIIITRLGEDVISDFFSLWVNSDSGKGQVLSAQGGLAQQHFNVGAMKNLLVPKVTLAEQELILEAAGSLLNNIELETHHLLKLKLQKQGLMQDLLMGNVAVPV